MGSANHIRLVAGIYFILILSQAAAQQEQWLQYHSEREARLIGGGIGMHGLEVSSEKPSGVRLPQFKGKNQFFAKWSTPMVKSGYLWVLLDRERKYGVHDTLYIDSNGNGHLNDEESVKSYRLDQYSAYFGPVKVIFEVEDGLVSYHLNFRFYNRRDYTRLYVSSGGWYEGDIIVGDSKKHCVLFDYNTNGTFNDKSLQSVSCDRIRIGKMNSQDTRYVGNYIEIDGTLYRPEIARDGAFIKLTKAKDVKFGTVRLPETITEFSAGGENGLFTFNPEKGIGTLPVGKYRVNFWAAERKDEKDTSWRIKGSNFGDKNIYFDITEDKETQLSPGEPINAALSVNQRQSLFSFSQELRGRNGERIELTRNGTRPRAPKLQIKSEDGSYERTFSFEYG